MEKEISLKIRKLRNEKGLTLRELGEKTQLSVSFLSQIERGVSSMTLSTLKKIVDVLDTSMKEIMDVEEESDFVIKNENRASIILEKSCTSYVRLSGKFEGRQMEHLIITMQPNFYGREAVSHSGEEFYYVLSGVATFVIKDIEYTLCSGESIHFPSTSLHRKMNKEDVELIMLTSIMPKIF